MTAILTIDDMRNTAIPAIAPVTGWKEWPIIECGERLVPLGGAFLRPDEVDSSERIFADSIYWGERDSSPYARGELKGALLTAFVREGIAHRLVRAASMLPEGYALLIWDAYRPLSVQKALYDDYYQQLIERGGLIPEAATAAAQVYVSIPSSDPTKPSPHNTGASVDLSIIQFDAIGRDELKTLNRQLHSIDLHVRHQANKQRMRLLCQHSAPLPMGAAFDEAEAHATTRFYEEKLSAGTITDEEWIFLANRRVLFHLMAEVGLSNYRDELWHYDHGNQFDAIRTQKPHAIYGMADFSLAIEWERFNIAAQYTTIASGPMKAARPSMPRHPKARRLEVVATA